MSERYDPYLKIAEEYDTLIGPRHEVKYLVDLVKRSHPKGDTILELACGTGALLKHFASTHTVSGLDYSKPMIAKAKRIIPSGEFYSGNMIDFDLKKRFDIVLCLFNSLNHLNNFNEWKQTFRQAKRHLNPGGVLIFDINTPLALENFAADPFIIEHTENQFITTEYSLDKNGLFTMHAHIFTKVKGATYNLQETKIFERAYPTERIQKGLKSLFSKVTAFDPDRKRPSQASEVLYFVCKL